MESSLRKLLEKGMDIKELEGALSKTVGITGAKTSIINMIYDGQLCASDDWKTVFWAKQNA